jgi:soluble cytochrome b562
MANGFKKSGLQFQGVKKGEYEIAFNAANATEFRSIIKDVEAGTRSVDDAQKAVNEKLAGAVSKQLELNKLAKEEENSRGGLVNNVKRALGFSFQQNDLTRVQKQLTDAIESNDEERIKNAQELVSETQKLNKAQKEAFNDFKSFFPGFVNFLENIDKARGMFNQIAKRVGVVGGGIAAGLLIGLAVLVNLVKQANALSQEFGGGLKANRAIAAQLKLSNIRAKFFALSAEQVRSSFDAIASTFGDVSVASAKFAVDLARVSRDTGVSAENVANLVSLFNPLTNGSRQLSLDLIESVSSLARAQGVASGVLIDELASNADLFASFIGKGEQNLIKAAAAAKKVGVEFGSIVELGDGLLDITERINKEQTLSTILGKQISLERFTALNAAGDTVAAQEELARLLRDTADLSPQLRRIFASELGLGVADIQRLTGLRSGGMPMASVGGGNDVVSINKAGFEQMTRAINRTTTAVENQ